MAEREKNLFLRTTGNVWASYFTGDILQKILKKYSPSLTLPLFRQYESCLETACQDLAKFHDFDKMLKVFRQFFYV